MQTFKNSENQMYHLSSKNKWSSLEIIPGVLVEHLRGYILEDQNQWEKWTPYITFVFNTTA